MRRSGLTMPVVTEKFINKAWLRGCDFITLDLEDSVPQHLKEHARTLIKDAIANVSKGGAYVFVRINHDTVLADLEAVVWPGVTKIKYPKAEAAEEVRQMDELITKLERERGIKPGTIEIGAGIESAVGVTQCYEIAKSSPRIKEFGGAAGYDISCDLGVEMFVGFDQFVYTKGEVELVARALSMELLRAAPFVANTTGSVSDSDRALREAKAARACGFKGSGGGLNPAVVGPHNAGYTPSDAEVNDAIWVLEKYKDLIDGPETWLRTDDRVIDQYEAARARDTLVWAEMCKERDLEKERAVAQAKGKAISPLSGAGK